MKPLDPRLLRHARAASCHLVRTIVAGLATTALVLAQAEVVSRGIARAVRGAGAGVTTALTGTLVGLGAVVLARSLLAGWQERAGQRAAALVRSQLRARLVRAAVAQHAAGTAATGRAETATLAARGLDALDDYVARYLPQLVLAAVVPVAVIVRLAFADVKAAVIVAVTLPLIPVFMALIGRVTEAAGRRRWRALARLSHHFLDVVQGMPTLKAFGRGKAQIDNVARTTDRYRRTTMATLRVAFLSSLALELLATLSVALVAVSVGLRLVDGGLELPRALLVIVLAPEAYLPLRQVGVLYHASAEGLAAADAAFAVIDANPAQAPGVVPVPDDLDDAVVEVVAVCVDHPARGVTAPAGVSFTVRPGEVAAVVGPSGSGKSSLLRTVLGLSPPTRGAVRLVTPAGALDVASLDAASWRGRTGWVTQTPYVATGTVADNVRLGAPAASDADVAAALAAAGLPAGMASHPVGERGAGLSAGERRRVGLARALVRRPWLLLLDEVTAGLDAATEASVLAHVRAAADGGTAVVLVTHRPAAVAVADRIVSLSEPVAAVAVEVTP